VHHPSHLDEELVDMERKLKGAANTSSSRQGRSVQGPLVKHKQHGQHHWFSLQEPRDAEQLQQAAKHITHCLQRGVDSGGMCTVSFGAHQAQELSALLCLIQDQLLQSSPSSVLAFQPPLPAQHVHTGHTPNSSSRQPPHHQQPGHLAVQLQLVGLQHLPNLHSAACALSSQDWGSPSGPAAAGAAAAVGTYPPHPSYAAIFARQLAECLPCISVGTCSDRYATAASLCRALLRTTPAVMAVSASPAAHEAMLDALTRARRHLAAEAADVDLLTLLWPLSGQVHWQAAAGGAGAAAAGGGGAGEPGGTNRVAADTGATTAAAGSSAGPSKASNGSSGSAKAAAAHSQQAELLTWQQWQQQVSGMSSAAGHGVTKDLGVLVLPWWGPAA
jgi:hypothetical protein